VSIDDIERVTGVNFFRDLADDNGSDRELSGAEDLASGVG
jgi:hypothetical protein